MFIGIDTHALAEPALVSAIEVFAANGVDVMVDQAGGYTPTPVISHAILSYNKGRTSGLADGVVITPSHNPPEDGGYKYNPPHGGPADTDVTGVVEKRANALLADGLKGVARMDYAKARKSSSVHAFDFVTPYVADLGNVVDLELVKSAGVNIGIDPLGGAAVHYWHPIIERYGLKATVVNEAIDPTFRFMTVDWDGKIRMDCSSPYAMASLIHMKDRFDVAFANDTDADRHGIVTPTGGLMNPNHYLATAIAYLFAHRPHWGKDAAIGKTVVSRLCDRSRRQEAWPQAGRDPGRLQMVRRWPRHRLVRLRRRGECRGLVPQARRHGVDHRQGRHHPRPARRRNPGQDRTQPEPALRRPHRRFLGVPHYERIDVAATAAQKSVLKSVTPEQLGLKDLAGDPVRATLSKAPGNGQPFGGIKVETDYGWFAARPSGTEDVYKVYAESFRSTDHLHRIQQEAQAGLKKVFGA